MPSVDIVDNPDAGRYETDGGHLAYRRDGDVVTMTHTEVDPQLEGQGIGSELVRHALDDVRSQGLRVRPSCPFVAAYIREHPEYGDLVSDD
jgi:predicted GNAT family acetyltransferase